MLTDGARARVRGCSWLAAAVLLVATGPALAQQPGRQRFGLPARATDTAAVREIAEAALAAITIEDWGALTDLMVDETVIVAAVERQGTHQYRARTPEQERNGPTDVDIVERGFDPDVRVAGNVGLVWFPYDLYVDGEWSHCGVDVFTLIRTDAGWRIASLIYSVEQPPACRPHPAGPPQ